MSTVCPSCGVAVVSGYVRCPKCHASLGIARLKRSTGDPGGTALPQRSFPVMPVMVAVGVAAAFVGFGVFGTRSKRVSAEVEVPVATEQPILAAPSPAAARAAAAATPSGTAAAMVQPAAEVYTPPDRSLAIAELENALRTQRLWGRVDQIGVRLDLRSGSCSDAQMVPLIDSKRSVLHSAGLTKLRCLEQSGAVVFERDL